MINGKDQEIITINKTGNSILNNAKYSADNTDEWYTTYETIAEELSHYKNQFIDKVVLCNCDDPLRSAARSGSFFICISFNALAAASNRIISLSCPRRYFSLSGDFRYSS